LASKTRIHPNFIYLNSNDLQYPKEKMKVSHSFLAQDISLNLITIINTGAQSASPQNALQ
jgi:hypothetical protein